MIGLRTPAKNGTVLRHVGWLLATTSLIGLLSNDRVERPGTYVAPFCAARITSYTDFAFGITSKRGPTCALIPGQPAKPPNIPESADAAPNVIEPSPLALSDRETSVRVR